MGPAGAAGQADDCTARIHIPVRGAQPGKCRDHVHILVVLDLPRQCIGFRSIADDTQFVTQPLHSGAGNEYRTLQRVGWLAIGVATDRGQQTVFAHRVLITHVHQQKAACAIGVFGLPGIPAGLSVQGCLLITRHPGDRHAGRDTLMRNGFTEHARAVLHAGQHGLRHIEQPAQFGVPAQFMDVVEQGA